MRTKIDYESAYAVLTVELESGEAIRAEPGAMVAQQGVEMETRGGGGGVFGAVRRSLGGESFFMNTFSGLHGGGWVMLAPSSPGDIAEHELIPGENLFLQGGAFMACTEHVEVDSKFQGFRGLFSGESIFFLRVGLDGPAGSVFYNSYGSIHELQVLPGEELVVDTGHLVAFTDGVDYTIGKVGGLRSILAGGEGLVMKFQGTGRVWIQTRNLVSLADKLSPFLKVTRSK